MKNKIFFITLIFTMLLCSTCFAVVSTDYEESTIADYDYDLISSNKLDFLSTCLNVVYSRLGTDLDYYSFSYNETDSFYTFVASSMPVLYTPSTGILKCSGNVFVIKKYVDYYMCRHNDYEGSTSYFVYGYSGDFIYTNHDIYTGENFTGDLVFQQTPLTILETVEKTIIQTVPMVKMKIVETLGTLVPIAMVVLSMLLLIYLIRLVISRVG